MGMGDQTSSRILFTRRTIRSEGVDNKNILLYYKYLILIVRLIAFIPQAVIFRYAFSGFGLSSGLYAFV